MSFAVTRLHDEIVCRGCWREAPSCRKNERYRNGTFFPDVRSNELHTKKEDPERRGLRWSNNFYLSVAIRFNTAIVISRLAAARE